MRQHLVVIQGLVLWSRAYVEETVPDTIFAFAEVKAPFTHEARQSLIGEESVFIDAQLSGILGIKITTRSQICDVISLIFEGFEDVRLPWLEQVLQ